MKLLFRSFLLSPVTACLFLSIQSGAPSADVLRVLS